MELYKKYRPKKLERVIGNEETVLSLQNMMNRKTLPHTILFTGPSGCGKTTLARILKKELGCSDMDFKELNCSDFRGIDTIREIIRTMKLSPMNGPCRIWLLDEVHQLSKDGQNAALKMLEDTPDHVYFFLATTDPQKLIKTIQTRCCEMPVRLLTDDEMSSLLAKVARKEKASISESVFEEIIEVSMGSARSALVYLDKIINLPKEKQEEVLKVKISEENKAIDLCRALIKKENWSKIAGILKTIQEDPESIRWAVLGYARAVLLNKPDYQAYLVIDCFQNHFYDSKHAGLVRACYECIHGE